MIAFEMVGFPPNPNRQRGHWGKRWSVSRQWRDDAHRLAVNERNRSVEELPFERATLEATFFVTVNRRRDEDNFIASLKPVIDGCVLAGLIVDDSQEVLHIEPPKFERRAQSGLRIVIRSR